MRKTFVAALAVTMLLVSAVGAAASNRGGPHDRATGDVTWTSVPGAEGLRTVFNAHDGAPGARPDRGTVTQYSADGLSMRVVELVCVTVQGDEAFFAGPITEATGDWESTVGDWRTHWVLDAGTPGSEGDRIGINTATASICDGNGPNWKPNGAPDGFTGHGGVVTAGNLNVFSSDS